MIKDHFLLFFTNATNSRDWVIDIWWLTEDEGLDIGETCACSLTESCTCWALVLACNSLNGEDLRFCGYWRGFWLVGLRDRIWFFFYFFNRPTTVSKAMLIDFTLLIDANAADPSYWVVDCVRLAEDLGLDIWEACTSSLVESKVWFTIFLSLDSHDLKFLVVLRR